MTDELHRFRTAWGDRSMGAGLEPAKQEPLDGLVRNVMLLDRRQLRRKTREIAVAAGATGILAMTLMWATELWFRNWILILILSAALIAVWRSVSLLRRRRSSPASSLASFCRAELSRLDTEIRLQRTLAWWYLAPILIGTNLYVFLSSGGSATAMMVVFPLTAIVVVAIALATRRSLRSELLSLRDELACCLDELEADGSPLSALTEE